MSWADYGIGGNKLGYFKLNPRFKPVENPDDFNVGFIEAILKATTERAEIIDSTFSGLYKFAPISTLLINIESAINTIIPYFVNHTINGGNFNNLSSVPMWTKEDILAYLDEDEITYNPLSIISEWAWQKYKILNLLRWVFKTYSYTTLLDKQYTKEGVGINWNTAIIDFDGANYQETNANYYSQHGSVLINGEYFVSRYYSTAEYINETQFSVDIDMYLYFYNNTSNYINNDYPANNNTYYKTESFSINSLDSKEVVIGENGNITVPEPVIAGVPNSYTVEAIGLVNKFNFIFQDNTI